MRKYLEKILFILIIATFFAPLVISPGHFIFPFIVPKIVTLRSIILLMMGLYLLLLFLNWERYRIRSSATTIVVLLSLVSMAASTFIGVDWQRSFWDNHERMLGLFTVAHYVLFYFIITSAVKEEQDWRWLFRAFLFAGGIVMTIALIQKIQPQFLLNKGSVRSVATLGNAIYVGAYGMFLAFLAALLFLYEEKRTWKIYAAIGGALGLVGIFASGTRGVFLGIIGGGAALCLWYFFVFKSHKKVRAVCGGLLVLGIVLAGVLFSFRETTFVRHLPIVGPLLNTNFSTGTAKTRFMAWSIGIDAWKEKPIFGWGPNNYYYAFNKYYRPEFLRSGYGETWFDSAHNATVNMLAIQGTFGIITYLALFIVPGWVLFRRWKKGGLDPHLPGFGIAFLVAHYIQQFFVFEDPTSYLYFFFFLAFLNRAISYGSPQLRKAENEHDRRVPVGVFGLVCLASLFLIFVTNINPARANMSSLETLRSVYNAKDDATERYKDAINIPTPHIDDLRIDFARSVAATFPDYVKAGKQEYAKTLLEFAYGELKKNLELHPLDIRIHLQLTQMAQMAYEVTRNPEYILEAERFVTDGLSKSPHRQQMFYSLAGVKFQLQKKDEAIELLEQARQDDRTIGESWWRLALVYKHTGDTAKAIALIEEAKQAGVTFDAQGDAIIASILPAPVSPESVNGTAPESP